MMGNSYPLHWPVGYPRTKGRDYARFKMSLQESITEVMDELRKFGKDSSKAIDSLTISSNATFTNESPADPGVACYFRWDNMDVCLAIDRYTTVRANLRAVALVIEAERTKLRHGGLNIVRASFRGYAALPPPKGPDGQLQKPWWMELGFDDTPTLPAAEARYREVVKTSHPDRGGDAATFNLATNAIRQAREELRT